MNCNRFIVRCECGSPVQPHSLWLTDTKSLCISGLCVACEKLCNIVVELAELFKNCPLPDLKQLDASIGQAIEKITEQNLFNSDDKIWLLEQHIKE